MLHFVRMVALGAAAVVAAVAAPFAAGHQATPRHNVVGLPADGTEPEAGSLRLTFALTAQEAQQDRTLQSWMAEVKAANDKQAADAAAEKAAAEADAARQAAQRSAVEPQPAAAPAPAAVPAPTGSVPDIIRAAFSPLGQGAVDWALRVARCESGYNPSAYNPAGPYMGLFQFLQSTWNHTPYAGSSPYDANANARAAAWLYSTSGPGQWGCK